MPLKNPILFGRYSYRYLIPFTHQFATMIEAGLPIAQALRTLAQQQKSYGFRAIIDDLYQSVQRGESLSAAMARHPEAFDKMYLQLISASEKSGMLENALSQLTKYLERKRNLRRQAIRSIIYPAFVLCAAVFILVALRFVLLPMFAGPAVSGENNPIGKTVGHLLSILDAILICAVLLPVIIVFVSRLLKRTYTGAYLVDWIKLHIPILGGVFRRAALARFTRCLGMLTRAGISILDALSLSREVTGNEVIGRQIDFVREQAKSGSSLTEPLRQCRAVDIAVVDMIETGEESGKLEESLLKVAEYYENEVEEMTFFLLGMLKPILIIFICALMGYMIIVMWTSVLSSVGLR